MGVMVALVPLPSGGVQSHIGNHAPIDKGGLHEGPHQRGPLCVRQLVGQGDRHLAGELSVLAPLHLLDGVPQRGPIPQGFRCAVRGEDLGVQDARAVGVIMLQALAVGRDFADSVQLMGLDWACTRQDGFIADQQNGKFCVFQISE